jgi:hypothetical protein
MTLQERANARFLAHDIEDREVHIADGGLESLDDLRRKSVHLLGVIETLANLAQVGAADLLDEQDHGGVVVWRKGHQASMLWAVRNTSLAAR